MSNIKDVAKYAGVGLGTVSRYLNGYNVTENNRKNIELAIKALDFQVNPIARTMKTGKTMTIAVIVPRLANLFSMRFIEAIEDYLENIGYSVIVCDSKENPAKELEKLKFVVNKKVDGIVLMSVNNISSKVKTVLKGTPLVLVDRVFDDNSFDSITVENYNSSFIAIQEALLQGIKKVVILAGPQNISTAKLRLTGALDALKSKGINLVEESILESDYSIEAGYKNLKSLLPQKPELVFASNYELTLGAIKAINEEGLIIGRDLRLVGFDSLELVDLIPHSMTVIAQPVEDIGKQAAACISDRIDDNKSPVKNIRLSNKILHL